MRSREIPQYEPFIFDGFYMKELSSLSFNPTIVAFKSKVDLSCGAGI
jgi:hypothetical protein